MNYLKLIDGIIKEKFNSRVLKIKDSSKGFDHKVFIATTKDKDVVIRFPIKEKNKLMAQAWAFEKWKNLGLPVPKIFFVEKDYLIEEMIEGTDMNDADLSLEQQQKIMYTLGKIVHKMHTVKTQKFGYFKKPGIGEKDNWKTYVEKDFRGNLTEITKAKLITEQLNKKINTFFNERRDILNFSNPRLLHQDLSYDNIMVKNGKLSGIIDASDAISGDPMQDLAVINQHNFKRDVMKDFFKGYGKIDMKEINFYSLIHSIWLINLAGNIIPNKEWLKKHIDSAKHYLSAPGEN